MGAITAGGMSGAFISIAGGNRPPFKPIPAASNIAALKAPAVLATPAALMRLSSDMRPVPGQARRLGGGSYAWTSGGRVCTLMVNGTGGCFTEFTKPVVLYLTADQRDDGSFDSHISGVIPDSVTALKIILGDGSVIQPSITDNAFSVGLPGQVKVAGEKITLADGSSFSFEDPVSTS